MATFYAYDVEGYGGLDRDAPTLMSSLDLGSRLPGDVLHEMMYAAPDGSVSKALYAGCTPPGPGKTIDEDKIKMLRNPHGRFALAADPRMTAKAYLVSEAKAQRSKEMASSTGGAVVSDAYKVAVPAAQQRFTRYSGATKVVPHMTPCECKSIIHKANVRRGDNYTDNQSRYLRDFHARDQRYFNDGDRITQEFYDLANASTLAISLVRTEVIMAPPSPLVVLAGRSEPCACSVLGPEMVHRIYLLMYDHMERIAVDRQDPLDRNMGAVLTSLNKQVVEHFSGEDYNRNVAQDRQQRVLDMAKRTPDAGNWDYNPMPRRDPSKGRVTTLVGELGGVPEQKRGLATRLAARYGYTLENGMLIDPSAH
jgi:hypothetical protein